MFEIIEPYRNTKQNLVKERHEYANYLAHGLYNYNKAIIEIEIKDEKKIIESYHAAEWLDNFFYRLISRKSLRAIDKWVLNKLKVDYLTLDKIKKKIKINVLRDNEGISLFNENGEIE